MAESSRTTGHVEPCKVCPSIAPLLEKYHCQLAPGHTGHHVFNEIVRWPRNPCCPGCGQVWDDREGRCVDHDCIGRLLRPCISCDRAVGMCFEYTTCALCERLLCGDCKQELDDEPFCPDCVPKVLRAAGSSCGTGATGEDIGNRDSPVAPKHSPDGATR